MKAAKTLDLVRQAALAALDKKASDLVVLDLNGVASLSGYFLLCTGESSRQVQAISNGIEERLLERGVKPHHIEGYRHAEWILLDYLDFVVHVFSPRARAFYDLERLWRPAKRLALPEDSKRK
ncbi:MAG TPA: ribosome silencing factor [Candidatus Xenobia bacterium]|nr:ribosome silencing factor [Candidatus Xenobia bacterium]